MIHVFEKSFLCIMLRNTRISWRKLAKHIAHLEYTANTQHALVDQCNQGTFKASKRHLSSLLLCIFGLIVQITQIPKESSACVILVHMIRGFSFSFCLSQQFIDDDCTSFYVKLGAREKNASACRTNQRCKRLFNV